MEQWLVKRKGADFQRIAEKFHISPIGARLIRNRDIIGDEQIDFYLHGTLADLYDGMLMQDMDRAVDLLIEKIREGAPIRIIGDYDIDGVNATYILQEGIAGLGGRVDTDIPDRIRDGYGLNKNLLERALADGIDTVITCDNGIAAAEEIAYGKERGLTIIVTDHHQVPYIEVGGEREYQMPPADAVVDPHRPDCTYPFKDLCGTAVAYKLLECLYQAMGREAEETDLFLENVAVATVGDVMDLIGENRIFVKEGLEMLRRTRNEGMKALIGVTNLVPEKISAYHIGFVLGPCINASGRLNTAKRALQLLSAKDPTEAALLARELKALNDSRKEMTREAIAQAEQIIEKEELQENPVLVIYLPDCHESIAGIVAGKIRERYYRPVFILTKGEAGLKGSGRSIDEYHMFEELCKCQSLFTRFGGHKLAAGLSMPEENFPQFCRIINEQAHLTQEDLTEKISVDMQLPIGYISQQLVEEIELLAPFGKGNPRPAFAERNLQVHRPRIFGQQQNVLRFQVEDVRGNRMDACYFGDAVACMETIQETGCLSVIYHPTINEYGGRKSLQMIVSHYRSC